MKTFDWDECAVAPPAARHEAKCAFCGGLDGACNGALRMLPRPIVLDADADGTPRREGTRELAGVGIG